MLGKMSESATWLWLVLWWIYGTSSHALYEAGVTWFADEPVAGDRTLVRSCMMLGSLIQHLISTTKSNDTFSCMSDLLPRSFSHR